VEGDHYTPSQAARILSRSGRKISERRIRQMLQAGELEGEQTETGRWKIPQSVVHALLERRREQDQLSESPERLPEALESGREYRERVEALQRELGRLEGRLELTEQTESTLREQLERERERADRLEAELERERQRGFWSRLFGSS
jgi:chromosome segregation ATPase